jgi:glycogen synthase
MVEKPLHIGLAHIDFPPLERFGGIARYIAALAKGYVRLGHRVSVVCRDNENPRVDTWEGVTVHRLRVSDAPLLRLPKGQVLFEGWETSRLFSQKLHEIHQKDPLDIVEFCSWAGEGYAFSRNRCAPYVVRVSSMLWQLPLTIPGYKTGPAGKWHRRFEEMAIPSADLILTPSHEQARLVGGHFKLKTLPTAIHHGLDLPGNPPAPTLSTDGTVRFLFVSTLSSRKGFDLLVQAFASVHAASSVPVTLDVVGWDPPHESGGTYGEWALSQIPESARAAIRYHGIAPDDALPGLYAACDAFVCPSRYESFGLIFLEAMRFKKPVIGCIAGGIPEVAPDGVAGILVPPDDRDALARALKTLAEDRALRTRLGQSAFEFWEKGFTERAMCENSIAVYRMLLSGR